MKMIEDEIELNKFKTIIIGSVLVHLLLLLLPSFLSLIGIDSLKKAMLNVKIVESAVRVDIVEMPKHTLNELKHLQDIGGAVELSEKPQVENSSVADQENFLEFLKETSKKNVKKIESKPSLDSKKSGKNLSKILSKDLKNIILAGNKLSAGSAITGSSNPQDDSFSPEFRNYFGRIPDLVRKNWKLPSYLAKDQFRCRIRLYIQPSGEVIKAEILESSQSKEYDERAVRSVYASSPFPALPSGSEHHGKQVTIVLVFPL